MDTSYSYVSKNLVNFGLDIKEKPHTPEEAKRLYRYLMFSKFVKELTSIS